MELAIKASMASLAQEKRVTQQKRETIMLEEYPSLKTDDESELDYEEMFDLTENMISEVFFENQ